MGKNGKNAARRAAICGVLCAMCVTLLYLGSITVFDMSVIVFCAVITMIVRIEFAGSAYPWLYVGVTGVLALLLLPSKLLAVEYLLIGGLYPLAKATFEKLHPVFAWLLKISFVDSVALLEILISRILLVSETARIDLTIPALLLSTAFAVLYDIALTMVVSVYILKIRKKIGLKKLF